MELRNEVIKTLDKALIPGPGRFRMKFVRWIFPEITDIANALRHYYWAEHCPKCGCTDVESPGLDCNRYCNVCGSNV